MFGVQIAFGLYFSRDSMRLRTVICIFGWASIICLPRPIFGLCRNEDEMLKVMIFKLFRLTCNLFAKRALCSAKKKEKALFRVPTIKYDFGARHEVVPKRRLSPFLSQKSLARVPS